MHAFLPPVPVGRVARPASGTCPAVGAPLCSAISRRAVLRAVPGLATLLVCSRVVRADRTGKYSTKLTAKRRYLPRIAAGFEALRVMRLKEKPATEWKAEVQTFVEGPGKDLSYAMPLFSSTYFSEGNRISPRERELKEVEESFFAVVQEMGKAKSFEEAWKAQEKAIQLAKMYVEKANIRVELEEANFPGFD